MDSGLARRARPGMTACEASPSLPLHDPVHVAGKLHAAEGAALVELPHGIGLEFRLLRKRMLAKILRAAGRAVTQVVGAVVIPPGALVIGGAVQNLEMDVGMLE